MIALLLALLLPTARAGVLVLDDDEDAATAPQPAAANALWPQSSHFDGAARSLRFTWSADQPEEALSFDEIIRFERARTFEASPDELFVLLADGRRVLLSQGADVAPQAALLPTLTGFVLKDLPAGKGHYEGPPGAPPALLVGAGASTMAIRATSASKLGPVAITAPATAGEVQTDPAFDGEGGGALDKAEIDPVIKAKMGRLQACYQREYQRNPGLAGRVAIRFVIDRDGSVKLAKVRSTTMNNAAVEQCLIDEIQETRFPAPKGGTVVITYPFNFSGG